MINVQNWNIWITIFYLVLQAMWSLITKIGKYDSKNLEFSSESVEIGCKNWAMQALKFFSKSIQVGSFYKGGFNIMHEQVKVVWWLLNCLRQ